MQGKNHSESRLFDVVIAGAGAAGSTLAGELVRQGLSVALVEAGPDRRRLVNRVPALAFLASINARTNWNFQTAPIPALNGRSQAWSQGRMVGGSGSINGMLWMRGTRADYDQWEAAGCPGWGWDAALDSYRRIEGSDRRGDPLHGSDGPLKIRRSGLDLPLRAPFLAAMQSAGLPIVDDVNGDICEGFGSFDVNIAGGERCSPERAWLRPLRRDPNLTLFAQTTALRVCLDQGRATGLLVRRGQDSFTLQARHQVVLCCGALLTPLLLMRSGLGPAKDLARAGIAVQRDCPQVGQNLHNHPAVSLRYALGRPLSAARFLRPGPALAAGLRYAFGRKGPLGESYVAMGGLFHSQPGAQTPADMMAVVMPALVRRAEVGARLRDVFERGHGFAVAISLARQKSRGQVTLDPSAPDGAPVIAPETFSHPEDMTAMVRAALRLRQALTHSSALGPDLTEIAPLAGADSPAALEAAIRAACGTFYHPGGTCRMGGEDAPVDPELKFRGIAGLRIADASVVPVPMGATMHAPAILIGARAAQLIMRDIRTAPPATGARS